MAANIAEAIRDALEADGRITSRTIHVSVEDESISLHGVVDSLEEMGLAEEIAEAASGCKAIHNHLAIDREVDTGPCCPQM